LEEQHEDEVTQQQTVKLDTVEEICNAVETHQGAEFMNICSNGDDNYL